MVVGICREVGRPLEAGVGFPFGGTYKVKGRHWEELGNPALPNADF